MKPKYIARMIVLLSFLFYGDKILAEDIASYIKIKYENITLYDISPSLVSKEKGEKIILGKIIIPGGKIFLKQDKVKAELYNIGIKNQNIPSTITVERDFVELPTATIEKSLIDILKKGKTDFDYNVSISTRDTLRMPTGIISFGVEEGLTDKLGKKSMKALVYENSKVVYEFPFTLSTGKSIKDYTLIKDVEKGEKFDPSQVSVTSQMVYEDTKLKSLEIGENYVYTEKLLAGTKLTQNNLDSNTVIKKGDKIAIEISSGDMKISDRGEALEKGDIGQEISIKNIRTGKILKGIVTGNNTVEIKIE